MKKKIFFIIAILFLLMMIGVGITAYQLSLKSYTVIEKLTNTLHENTNENDSVIFDLNTIAKFIKIVQTVKSSRLAYFFLPTEYKSLIEDISAFEQDINTVVTQLSKSQQKWIIIFQNSNEIRATGGFMGSYSIVDINQGKIVSITTEDIYDADGQFEGYVEAPPGVAEYLSSGNGMRLPDANWNPDMKESAQQVLHFFALGKKQNIYGVIFVNLDFAKNLLDFIGPIEISDYNTVVTSKNIDEVLRSRRDEFFPGSIQKKHMLSQLLTQVKIKILKTEPKKIHSLLQLIGKNIEINNLQFFSINQTIDDIFQKNYMRQAITYMNKSDFIYLVESNVGINKSNKNISRSVIINTKPNKKIVTINFSNDNDIPSISKLTNVLDEQFENNGSNHLSYINYQRILVPNSWILKKILYQNSEIIKYDENTVNNTNANHLKEIGFLITLAEKEKGTVVLEFDTDDNFNSIYIQKQPGIPAVNYTLEQNYNKFSKIIEKNSLIQYPL